MDPKVAILVLVDNKHSHPNDRHDAADGLLSWLGRGGSLPDPSVCTLLWEALPVHVARESFGGECPEWSKPGGRNALHRTVNAYVDAVLPPYDGGDDTDESDES